MTTESGVQGPGRTPPRKKTAKQRRGLDRDITHRLVLGHSAGGQQLVRHQLPLRDRQHGVCNTIQYELDSKQPAEKEKDTRGRRNGKFRGEETQRKEKQHKEKKNGVISSVGGSAPTPLETATIKFVQRKRCWCCCCCCLSHHTSSSNRWSILQPNKSRPW